MKELDTLIQTIRIYSKDGGIEFGIEKRALLIMKKRKKETALVLPNQESIWKFEKKKTKNIRDEIKS